MQDATQIAQLLQPEGLVQTELLVIRLDHFLDALLEVAPLTGHLGELVAHRVAGRKTGNEEVQGCRAPQHRDELELAFNDSRPPPPFFTDITPVLVEQLRKGGFDTTFKSPSNSSTIIPQGDIDAWLDIPGGSARDPYATLNFLHSRHAVPTGQPAVRAYRWKNADFDKLLETMAVTSPTDPKFMQLYHQAMELWFPNLPTIPLINRYIFITPSTAYWTNWPTEKNPYILPSSWHRTAGLFINTIQPAAG